MMSYDRTCRMSDLNQMESRMHREIAEAESAAHRAASRIGSIQDEMDATDTRVNQLVSDFSDLSGSFADHRSKLYGLEGEVAGLELKQKVDDRRIKQNESLIANLQSDLGLLEQDVEGNREAIEQVRQHSQVLQREVDLAHNRIESNSRHINQLQIGVQQINSYLATERRRVEQDRRSQIADAEAQGELAAILRQSLDPARVRRFGHESGYLTALTTLDHAQESTRLGRLEAARSTYQAAQREFAQVIRDVDVREREYARSLGRCEATLKQLENSLKEVDTDDMKQWYGVELQTMKERYETLARRVASGEFEQIGHPDQSLAALEQLTTEIAQLQNAVFELEGKLDGTIQKAKARVETFTKIAGVLMDVWGDNDFALSDPAYEKADDPKTRMTLETIRPNRPNVTMKLDLDGTVELSWTGYVGMECAKDVTQLEKRLRDQHKLELAVIKSEAKPGQPNPQLPPPPPEPTVMKDKGKGSLERQATLGTN